VVRNIKDSLFLYHSEAELLDYCNSNARILLDEHCRERKRFYGIEIDSVFLCIIGESNSLKPNIYKTDEQIIVSIDQCLYIFKVPDETISYKKLFDSYIYEILFSDNDLMYVICELGITFLDLHGNIIWSHTSDVITDFNLSLDHIDIKTDESVYRISTIDGTVI